MSAHAWAARLARSTDATPTMVLAGAVDPAPLRAAGWQLLGVLSTDPYADRLDAAPYVDAAEVVDDPRIDAVAVDGDDPELSLLLPELRGSGLLLLLPTAAPLDPELLRLVRAQRDAADAVVGLVARYEP